MLNSETRTKMCLEIEQCKANATAELAENDVDVETVEVLQNHIQVADLSLSLLAKAESEVQALRK